MAENSAIEWTDHTFNIAWGCVKVSEGCKNCYADGFARRYGYDVWGPAATTERRTFGETHWREPLKWNAKAEKAGQRARVFCSSMADVFEDHPTINAERIKLWALIRETPWLDWLLLTKRPENIEAMLPDDWNFHIDGYPNVWLGTSVENQKAADERIPILAYIPARVKFLSCEPLIGPVNLLEHFRDRPDDPDDRPPLNFDWVIAGGESGPRARPMNPYWAETLRDQCRVFGVAFFFKQWGEHNAEGKRVGKKNAGRLLGGLEYSQYPPQDGVVKRGWVMPEYPDQVCDDCGEKIRPMAYDDSGDTELYIGCECGPVIEDIEWPFTEECIRSSKSLEDLGFEVVS